MMNALALKHAAEYLDAKPIGDPQNERFVLPQDTRGFYPVVSAAALAGVAYVDANRTWRISIDAIDQLLVDAIWVKVPWWTPEGQFAIRYPDKSMRAKIGGGTATFRTWRDAHACTNYGEHAKVVTVDLATGEEVPS